MTNLATYSLTYPNTCEEECGTCYEGSRDPRYLQDEYYCDPCFLETGVRTFNFLRNVGRPHHFCEDVTMAKTLTVAGVSTFMSDAFAQMNLFVYGNSEVDGNSLTKGNSEVDGNSLTKGNSTVVGNSFVEKNLTVSKNFLIKGDAKVDGDSQIEKNSLTGGNSTVVGSSFVKGNLVVTPNQITVGGRTYVETRAALLDNSDLVLAYRNSQ